MVALHDCNEDVNRAINFLLESTSDTVWIYIHMHKPYSYIHTFLVFSNLNIPCLIFFLVNIFQNSWETVGKKRSLGKEGVPSDIKDIREKKGGEREASRGRGASNKRGRGISRGREGKKFYVFDESSFLVLVFCVKNSAEFME